MTDLRPLHVLLVEDNPINCQLVTALLGRDGHAVTVAGDGEAALAALERGRFDLVLMDIQLPRMNGIETTRRIRAMEGPAARLPVIALTAFTDRDQRAACREAGMGDVLSKPIDVPSLRTALAAIVRDRGV